MYSSEARVDNIANKAIRKSFFCLAASSCVVKMFVHGYMAHFYFKQSLVPGLHENAKKNYAVVIPPPALLREWATTPWGNPVEHTSYIWHSAVSGLWLCAGIGFLYAMRY